MVHVIKSTTNPTTAPLKENIHWLNTVTKEVFYSVGTDSVSDWRSSNGAQAGDNVSIFVNDADYQSGTQVAASVAAEAALRTSEDANLQSQITSNDTDISNNSTAITNEETSRISADTNLQNQIDSNDTDITNLQTEQTTQNTSIAQNATDISTKYDASNPSGFETPAELDSRDTANRDRSNHTGTQLASTISDFTAAVQNDETDTTLTIVGNTLRYVGEDGSNQDIDLSLYLDDTNLARLESGSIDVNGIATFTRDDASTFTVDLSSLLDNQDASEVPVTPNGNLASTDVQAALQELQGDIDSLGGSAIVDHSGLNLDDGTNPHGTTSSDVGLGNVDNTSDVNKPVSTAQQAALDLKADSASVYTKTELDSGQLDNRYYTETEIDSQQGVQNTNISQNATDIAQEITDRTNADAALQTQITNNDTDIAQNASDISSNDTDISTINTTIANFETSTQLDARDVDNRNRSNHTGTQTASTISDFTTAVQASETDTTLTIVGNTLRYIGEDGINQDVDLSLYLDDTNLARLVSGTVDGSGIATFTRDDASTFTVDLSTLLDNQTAAEVTVSPNGNLTSTDVQAALEELQGDIDGLSLDHGSLTGLGDDDHTQYHNDARGDIRYYTKAEVNTSQATQDTNITNNANAITTIQGEQTTQDAAIALNTAKVSADGSIDTHSDVDTSTSAPSNGDVLEWDGSNWTPTSTDNGYTIFPIWAEESGGLVNNNRQWSFGNGATGNINIVIPMDCELFAVTFDVETASSQVSMEVMIDDAVGFTTKTFVAKDFEVIASPIAITPGQCIGFRTDVETVAATDARVAAWFRIRSSALSTSVLNDLLDVSTTGVSANQILQFNGSNWAPIDLDATAVGLANVDNTSDVNKPVSTAQQAALDLKYDASNPDGYIDNTAIADFETTTELNTRDTNNRNRTNHTGTQTASTISDFNSAVQSSETDTTLTIMGNTLRYVGEDGTNQDVDLSLYLDDTNLARIVSGTVNSTTGIITVTRDDASTFNIDASGLLDNQVASEVPVTPSGNLTSTDTQAALGELQGDIDTINASTYVNSVNGETGAVADVAKTDEANTFSQNQQFNANISTEYAVSGGNNATRTIVPNDGNGNIQILNNSTGTAAPTLQTTGSAFREIVTPNTSAGGAADYTIEKHFSAPGAEGASHTWTRYYSINANTSIHSFANLRVTEVADPSSAQDAATKNYFDLRSDTVKVTNTLTGNLNTGITTFNNFTTTDELASTLGQFTFATNGITPNFTGQVEVTFNCNMTTTVQRGSVQFRWLHNGNNGPWTSTGYIRATSGHNQSSANFSTTISVVSGQPIQIQHQQEAAGGTVTSAANNVEFIVKRIK